ncbi:MAG TPA: DCC1-like thiol-disulfide oxidoreductase family protein [Gemmatimonadaceae bacterium]|jgi:predicted DCC family thiol-disulfide oxidoreductase YuxK
MSDRPAILLFDGTCGFCARNVQFVLRHDRKNQSLQFASLQSDIGTALIARHADLRAVDSVIWLEPATDSEPERVAVRSAAVLLVLQYLGGPWAFLATIGALVPRALRDALYDVVARHRQRLAGSGPSCLVPTPEQRARFLDSAITPPRIPERQNL